MANTKDLYFTVFTMKRQQGLVWHLCRKSEK